MDDVITANLTPFDDIWDYETSEFIEDPSAVPNHNDFELGKKGKWRPTGQAAYESSIAGLNSASPNSRNYNTGTFDNMVMPRMNIQGEMVLDNWKTLNKTVQTSPYGQVIEEQNLLDIYSCAKYGYYENVPYLVAQNADLNSVQFESFEMEYDDGTGNHFLEDGMPVFNAGNGERVIIDYAHSGQYAWRKDRSLTDQKFNFKPFKLTQQILDNGLLVSFWAMDYKYGSQSHGFADFTPYFDVELNDGFNSVFATGTTIAKTGEWSQIEFHITNFGGFVVGDQLTPNINWTQPLILNTSDVYLDDVRIQPYDAQVTCYVYDINTLRMLASLDDQHFASRFQYNSEGLLIRKIKETEKGDKTIEETYYNTPQVPR